MDWVGEVLGLEGGPRLVIGWTLAVLCVAWVLARLPGIAAVGLRNVRVLQIEWAAVKKPLSAVTSSTATKSAPITTCVDDATP